MSFSRSAIESIQREYDELRLAESAQADRRREEIEKAVPALESIENRLSSLYVRRAMAKVEKRSAEEISSIRAEIDSLIEERRLSLARAGYVPEDLEIRYSCNICKDTGYTDGGNMCACFRARLIEKMYDISHLRSILAEENFDTFDYELYSDSDIVTRDGRSCRQIAADAVSAARRFVRDFDTSDANLYITGDVGVGKTFLVNCIARELLSSGHFVIYLSAEKFFNTLADAAFGRTGEDDSTARYISECDLLIIDDLGTEFSNSLTQSYLFNCINERFLKKKHTVISSNLSPEDLRNAYSSRVYSRIISNYAFIKLFGKDLRVEKKLRRARNYVKGRD